MKNKKGVLLINLGTPNSPSRNDVKTYLKEFLSDPRVIDIPSLPRWILVNLLILPFRASSSSKLYRSIWTEQGSPLLHHGQVLTQMLQTSLGNDYVTALGMRYGQPSIASAIESLMAAGVNEIDILPLFPQYSSAATGSALEQAMNEVSKLTNIPMVRIHHQFYDHPAFINALWDVIQPELAAFNPDFLLLSYHGLPERQIHKSGDSIAAGCDLRNECPAIQPLTRFCYRAQCYETTRALQQALNWPIEKIDTAFQSRLGKTPWIKPYTDELLPKLASQGVKRLAIACPSFVADCLETIEEIGIQAKQQWLAAGGENFKLIPCLNSHPSWVAAIQEILQC